MGRLVACALLATVAQAGAKERDRYPAIGVYHVGHKREIQFKPYDAKGRFQRKEMRKLEDLLRCHHTGRRHAISSRLAELLYKTARHYSANRVEVISGYRTRKIARRKGTRHSYHTKGRAIDLRIPGVSNERLRDYLRTLPRVGVGYYPVSGFIHMDVRDDRSAYWIDRSGPGQRPAYVAEDEWQENQEIKQSEGALGQESLALPLPPQL